MPETVSLIARRAFRSLSRAHLGTVRAGQPFATDADHARDLVSSGFAARVPEPDQGRHSVGEHRGGGWYPVLDGSGKVVARVRGRANAEARAAELDARGTT